MALGHKIGLLLIGLLAGGIAGGLVGLCAGLAHTQLASVSGFEGYSGYMVAYWILAGIAFGALVGIVLAVRRAHR
jgi:hypothetical protein